MYTKGTDLLRDLVFSEKKEGKIFKKVFYTKEGILSDLTSFNLTSFSVFLLDFCNNHWTSRRTLLNLQLFLWNLMPGIPCMFYLCLAFYLFPFLMSSVWEGISVTFVLLLGVLDFRSEQSLMTKNVKKETLVGCWISWGLFHSEKRIGREGVLRPSLKASWFNLPTNLNSWWPHFIFNWNSPMEYLFWNSKIKFNLCFDF